MEEEEILKIQNNKDKLLTLLFLYSRNIKINLPIIDIDVAVYGKKSKLYVVIKVILSVVFIYNYNLKIKNNLKLKQYISLYCFINGSIISSRLPH